MIAQQVEHAVVGLHGIARDAQGDALRAGE
jgi:hypothetical protein